MDVGCSQAGLVQLVARRAGDARGRSELPPDASFSSCLRRWRSRARAGHHRLVPSSTSSDRERFYRYGGRVRFRGSMAERLAECWPSLSLPLPSHSARLSASCGRPPTRGFSAPALDTDVWSTEVRHPRLHAPGAGVGMGEPRTRLGSASSRHPEKNNSPRRSTCSGAVHPRTSAKRDRVPVAPVVRGRRDLVVALHRRSSLRGPGCTDVRPALREPLLACCTLGRRSCGGDL